MHLGSKNSHILQASSQLLLPQFFNFLDKADAIIKKTLSDVCKYIGAEHIVQPVEKPTTDKYKAVHYQTKIFTHLELCLATATHNFKSVKIIYICII